MSRKPHSYFSSGIRRIAFCFVFFSVSLYRIVFQLIWHQTLALGCVSSIVHISDRQQTHTHIHALCFQYTFEWRCFVYFAAFTSSFSSLFVRFRWWSMSAYLLWFDCHSVTLLVRFINKYDTNKIIHYYYLARRGDTQYIYSKKMLSSSWRSAMSIVFNSSLPSAIRASRIISMFFLLFPRNACVSHYSCFEPEQDPFICNN